MDHVAPVASSPINHQSCHAYYHTMIEIKTQIQLMSQLGPIQNHSNQATRAACDIDKTAQPPVVERSLSFSRVLYLSIMETIKKLI
jgi:hypothetical protein